MFRLGFPTAKVFCNIYPKSTIKYIKNKHYITLQFHIYILTCESFNIKVTFTVKTIPSTDSQPYLLI